MDIEMLQAEAHATSLKNGFWDEIMGKVAQTNNTAYSAVVAADMVGEAASLLSLKLTLIASEVFEALENLRSSETDIDRVGAELADIVIRVADFAGGLRINLNDAIVKKLLINKARPYKHGKRF